MLDVDIWTDGSVYKNPGPGGWAAILFSKSITKIIGGIDDITTNNRMEAWAVYQALTALKKKSVVCINTDSQYVIYGINRILEHKELLSSNLDIWIKVEQDLRRHNVTVEKVLAHSNDPLNNAADIIARFCMEQKKPIAAYIHDPTVLLGSSKSIREFINRLIGA